MNKPILLAATAVFASIVMLPSEVYADDKPVCYTWDTFPDERFKLNVKEHSPLSEPEEEKNFGHASQTAYSVHGKEVGGCGGDTMLATTGTVVTAKPSDHGRPLDQSGRTWVSRSIYREVMGTYSAKTFVVPSRLTVRRTKSVPPPRSGHVRVGMNSMSTTGSQPW